MRPWAQLTTVSLFLFSLAVMAGALVPNAVLEPVSRAAAATSPDEVLDDPDLERRARELSKEIRCLVCQNQSIDDSDADLARDLRRLVRERLIAGDSDDEIIDFLTQRYGDFVLLRPPMKPSTWILWYGPPALTVVAGIAVALYVRRRRAEPETARADDLSEEEKAKLDELFNRRSADPT